MDDDQSTDALSVQLRGLLDVLHAQQLCVGGSPWVGNVEDIRWYLQCLFVDTDVLDAADDMLLEHALDAAPGWRSSANGAWGVFDPNSPEERVQTTGLKERHTAAAAPVQPTRVVSRIVHLLRDPAYAKVRG